jgi:hypothetical protein
MIAITVSTNYDDLLEIIIPHNYIFFKKWYIITSIEDKKTLNVINNYKHNNIETIFFDFKSENAYFNKGGAIRAAQEHIKVSGLTWPILLLDSDIILPSDFMEIVKDIDIQADTLYGAEKRYGYYSYEALLNNKPDIELIETGKNEIIGFFQLYTNQDIFYNSSIDCSECDLFFSRKFKKLYTIFGLHVKHLGIHDVNWKGRIVKDFT